MQQLGPLQWGGRRYGLGLIKMMEWKSALAERVLGRSSNCNEFSATVIKLSSGSEGMAARKKEPEGDSAERRPDVVVALLIRKDYTACTQKGLEPPNHSC